MHFAVYRTAAAQASFTVLPFNIAPSITAAKISPVPWYLPGTRSESTSAVSSFSLS